MRLCKEQEFSASFALEKIDLIYDVIAECFLKF